jgi:predicted nucleotidyltransferase
MLDMEALRQLAEGQPYRPLFVTVSGAHVHGFPSPDSDVDLRGAHLMPLRDVIGLDVPDQTVERKLELAGVEVELVAHDLGKYLHTGCRPGPVAWVR